MRRPLRVLILEDEPADALLMAQALERAGLASDWTRVGTEADFLAALDRAPDLILADDGLPGFGAARALTHLVARGLDIPAIVVSDAVSEELAVECMKRGATDYLLKGQLMRLGPAVLQALEQRRTREQRRRAEEVAEALTAVGRELATSLDPGVVTDRIVTTLVRLFRVRRAVLFQRDPASDLLVCIAASDDLDPRRWIGQTIPLDTSIAGLAFRDGRPAWTADVLADPRVALSDAVVARLREDGAHSVVAVPLRARGEVLGALSLGDVAGRTLDADELSLLSAFADQVAIALQNARLFQATQSQLRQTETLLAVSQSVSSTLDPIEMMRRVAREAGRALGADVVGAVVPDAEGRALRGLAGYRVPKSLRPLLRNRRIPLKGHPFLVEAWEHQRAVFSSDVTADARIDRALVEGIPFRSVLFIPLLSRHDLVGGLLAAWRKPAREFTAEELRLAEGIGRQAALALGNTRLFESAERRREHAESLAELGRVVSQSLHPEVVGQRVANGLLPLLGAQSAALYRLEPVSENLVPLAVAHRGRPTFPADLVIPPGAGVVGIAVRERRPAVTTDSLTDPLVTLTPTMRAAIERSPHRAVLAAPILFQDRVIGALTVVDSPGRTFDDEEIRLAEAFADHAALALENARHYDESERRRTAAEVLAEIGRLVSQSLDPDDVGQRMIESVRGLFRAMHAVLHRLDLATGDLVAVAFAGEMGPRYVRNALLPRGTGMAGLAVREGRTVTTADMLADPRVELTPGDRARVEQSPFRAVMAVPLVVQERIIGALTIADGAGRAFTADEIELAHAVAHQAALALQNARLYDESERRRREAEELARLTRRLTGSLDVATVVQRVVDSVQELLGTRFAGLRLLQADGSLVAVASAGAARHAFPPGHVQPPGVGIMARVAVEGHAAWTPDLLAEPDVILTDDLRARLGQDHRALLVVPLRAEGETIGVLVAGEPVGRTFTTAEVRLLQAVADQAALALQNARSHEAAVRRGEEMSALLRAMRTVMGGLDLDVTLERIIREAGRIAGTPHVKLLLVDKDAGVLRMGAWAGGTVPPGFQVPLGTSYSGRVATTGQALSVRDTQNDPENLLAARDREQGIRTYLGLPIRFGDEVLGVLTFNTSEPHDYTPAELAYLGSFADQAALAIRNAQLLEQSRRAYEELARTQDHLVQGEKMQAVGRLAGGVAHDFNNLLTVILGRSHMLLKRLAPDDPLRRYAMLIHQTGERAAALTQQLLAFSRRQVLQPRVLDSNEVVAGMDKMLRRLIGEDIELVTRLGPGLGHVKADQAQLEQVLMNLAVNARDAMPLGGRLTITTGDVELDAAAARSVPDATPGRYVTLAVTDSGSGMDAATQARIFEPFFTTKGAGKGTGLGLATVFGIVRQSDGYIRVDSEVGRGSTFTIHLPRVDAPVEAAPREGPGQGIAGGSETVLLVEDESELRELTSEMLESLGYTVVTATDGQDALRIAAERAGRLQLLLTDVVMPQMSGRELAQRLGRTQPEVRVLYMSGYPQEAISRHGVLDPGTALIQKPFSPEALARKIREVLDPVPVPALAARQSSAKGVSHDQPARTSA